MHKAKIAAVLAALTLIVDTVCAAEAGFKPEVFTVEPKIRPGPNVFVLDQGWSGASQLNVLDGKDLGKKGNMSMGLNAQFMLSSDRKTAYTVSIYSKRISYGPVEAVLQVFDVETLTPVKEIILLDKTAQVASVKNHLALSADEKFAFVQNATPATSITVVDLEKGELTAEIPTPGCWGLYPAAQGRKISILCGDGSMASYAINDAGQPEPAARSEKLFDPDKSPLFVHAERVGDDWLFSSFFGEIFRISDAGAVPRLVDRFSYTTGIKGKWAPGGFAVMAYNPANALLYVTMHPNGRDGSHKDGAKEIWALDVNKKTVVSRSKADHIVSIAVTSGDNPVLYGLNDEDSSVTRFTSNAKSGFALKPAGKVGDLGSFVVLLAAGE
jgi:methylamine dehydrogenase heavy chain